MCFEAIHYGRNLGGASVLSPIVYAITNTIYDASLDRPYYSYIAAINGDTGLWVHNYSYGDNIKVTAYMDFYSTS